MFCSFISFILLRFILSIFISSNLSFYFSLCISLSLLVVFFALFNSKLNKKTNKLSKDKKTLSTLTKLLFMQESELFSLFFSAFSKAGKNPKKVGGNILLEEENCLVFLHFSFDSISKSQIIKFYNLLSKNQTALILSNEFSLDIVSFCDKFQNKIKLMSGEEVYLLLEKTSSLPNNNVLYFLDDKPKVKLSNVFNKKRAKNYFFFGIIFMLYSFIVPIKLYYIIVGSIFLILSLSCLLFAKEERN